MKQNDNSKVAPFFTRKPFTGYSPFIGQCDKYPEQFIVELENELYRLGASSMALCFTFEALANNDISKFQSQVEEIATAAGMPCNDANQFSGSIVCTISKIRPDLNIIGVVGTAEVMSLDRVSEMLDGLARQADKDAIADEYTSGIDLKNSAGGEAKIDISGSDEDIKNQVYVAWLRGDKLPECKDLVNENMRKNLNGLVEDICSACSQPTDTEEATADDVKEESVDEVDGKKDLKPIETTEDSEAETTEDIIGGNQNTDVKDPITL